MGEATDRYQVLRMATKIIAAYIGSNVVAMHELPDLIGAVTTSLRKAGAEPVPVAETPAPAVPISMSVTPEFLICLEDGRKMKMLKRHLASHHQMTPAEYRRRWGLSNDYPIVASAYAERRSALAKQIGLGRKPTIRALPAEPAPPVAPEPKRKAWGRRKAA